MEIVDVEKAKTSLYECAKAIKRYCYGRNCTNCGFYWQEESTCRLSMDSEITPSDWMV